MSNGTNASSHARRNRMIAIVAGAITVVAIVLGFAGDFLGLGMRWMRPAAELLLLAELVGLVVLERHQLFEPVHEKVAGIETTLATLTEHLMGSGQTTFYADALHTLDAGAATLRATLAREQATSQILRSARLGSLADPVNPELGEQFDELVKAIGAFALLPGSPRDSRARLWMCRFIRNMPNRESLDAGSATKPYSHRMSSPITRLF